MEIQIEILILGAVISAMPTAAIGILGFALRRNGDLSSLLASKEAVEKQLTTLNEQIREERDKRDALEEAVYKLPGEISDEYVKREDFVRNAGQIDHKLDSLSRRIEALRPPSSDC